MATPIVAVAVAVVVVVVVVVEQLLLAAVDPFPAAATNVICKNKWTNDLNPQNLNISRPINLAGWLADKSPRPLVEFLFEYLGIWVFGYLGIWVFGYLGSRYPPPRFCLGRSSAATVLRRPCHQESWAEQEESVNVARQSLTIRVSKSAEVSRGQRNLTIPPFWIVSNERLIGFNRLN